MGNVNIYVLLTKLLYQLNYRKSQISRLATASNSRQKNFWIKTSEYSTRFVPPVFGVKLQQLFNNIFHCEMKQNLPRVCGRASSYLLIVHFASDDTECIVGHMSEELHSGEPVGGARGQPPLVHVVVHHHRRVRLHNRPFRSRTATRTQFEPTQHRTVHLAALGR